ncbi:MAG: hypothetical protein B7Y25_06775 [Alphaproteobacteria bacterium 16-39-46]|nr:MAG: hypothetical protein B7Y25_06775 [Alphaproteobacteria bacterium 16-39-46]OZA42204.1 MAG: hypothetical protein B7X84_06850 [Alphaproteobacteria bacterium 17-39-52]HQS84807.1 hypothetical protein [Alphaproteobacteria bacterium]HQS94368.1 hypothetical protein [Alphaproteobacteria bacterium]
MKNKISLLCLAFMGMALIGLTNEPQARTDEGARQDAQAQSEAATKSDNPVADQDVKVSES